MKYSKRNIVHNVVKTMHDVKWILDLLGFELLLSELPTVTLTEETSGLYRRLLICFFYKLTLEALPISVF